MLGVMCLSVNGDRHSLVAGRFDKEGMDGRQVWQVVAPCTVQGDNLTVDKQYGVGQRLSALSITNGPGEFSGGQFDLG